MSEHSLLINSGTLRGALDTALRLHGTNPGGIPNDWSSSLQWDRQGVPTLHNTQRVTPALVSLLRNGLLPQENHLGRKSKNNQDSLIL